MVAKSRPAVLQAVTVDLASTGYSEIQLGCTDCPSYIGNVSYLQSGASLAELYSSYVCNPNHKNCTTVCLSSAQVSNVFSLKVAAQCQHFYQTN